MINTAGIAYLETRTRALLSAAAIILCACVERPPPRALVKSESKASEALRAVRAADARTRDAEARAAYADHVAQEAKGDAERREELNQALRARAQAADAAASAAEAREQASNARARGAERKRAERAEARRAGPLAGARATPVAAAGAPVYPPGQRPSWMTQVDCSAYDYSCASSRMRGAYEAYPMHRPPGEISDTLSLDSDGGAAFRKRVRAAQTTRRPRRPRRSSRTVVARGDGLRRGRRTSLQGRRNDAASAGGVAIDVARRPPAGRRFLGRRRAQLHGPPRTAQQAPGLDDDGQKVRARHALRRRAHGAARRRLREARRGRAGRADDARLRRGQHQRGVRRRVASCAEIKFTARSS